VLANVAIRKSGDFHVIVEIACVLSPEELLAVKRACKLATSIPWKKILQPIPLVISGRHVQSLIYY
jgi:hypothetical protein